MATSKDGFGIGNEPDKTEICRINDHNLYVEFYEHADGPAVIFLHHGLGSVKSWKDQAPYFAARGYRVLVYDRWGYGKSDHRSHFSMPFFEEDLADLESLMNTFQIDRAALIGHSDGGTIALYFAAQQPERAACLVTVAAHAFVEDTMPVGIYGICEAYERDEKFRDKLQRVHGDKTEKVFWGWCNSWMEERNLNWDMRAEMKRIRCPSLIIQGIDDEHATPQHAREIAKSINDAELWLVPEASHMLPQDNPEVFNQKIIEFLRRNI
jgi:pimeloyl-ACP methyl ester carboxylesterase